MSSNIQSYEAQSTQLMNDLQALDFALVEITLYLASHPYDENAITRHNELAEQRHATRDKLENRSKEASEGNESKGWRWSLSPWPWRV